jgi:hypothetical protein
MPKSFHNSLLGLVVASSALTLCATAASAGGDVLIDDEVTVVEESALPDDDDTLVVETPAPSAYAWVAPADCGTYYYWDGERCVDPRIDDRVEYDD